MGAASGRLVVGIAAALLAGAASVRGETAALGPWKAECRTDKLTDKKDCWYAATLTLGRQQGSFHYTRAEQHVAFPGSYTGGGLRIDGQEARFCTARKTKDGPHCAFKSGDGSTIHDELLVGSRMLVVLNAPGGDVELNLDVAPFAELIARLEPDQATPINQSFKERFDALKRRVLPR